jgi:hypothetical protein
MGGNNFPKAGHGAQGQIRNFFHYARNTKGVHGRAIISSAALWATLRYPLRIPGPSAHFISHVFPSARRNTPKIKFVIIYPVNKSLISCSVSFFFFFLYILHNTKDLFRL